jgi:hypothetical protein
MSRFHNYSFGTILEIARQKPDPIHVAGLYTWNQLGRRVKKGEKDIRILTPIVGAKRKLQEEAEKDLTRQNVPILLGFRAAYVFDISQTEARNFPNMHESAAMLAQTVIASSISSTHRVSSLSSTNASRQQWA